MNDNETFEIVRGLRPASGGVKVVCPGCGYEWTTRSARIYVCCPSCLRKVKIPKEAKK